MAKNITSKQFRWDFRFQISRSLTLYACPCTPPSDTLILSYSFYLFLSHIPVLCPPISLGASSCIQRIYHTHIQLSLSTHSTILSKWPYHLKRLHFTLSSAPRVIPSPLVGISNLFTHTHSSFSPSIHLTLQAFLGNSFQLLGSFTFAFHSTHKSRFHNIFM